MCSPMAKREKGCRKDGSCRSVRLVPFFRLRGALGSRLLDNSRGLSRSLLLRRRILGWCGLRFGFRGCVRLVGDHLIILLVCDFLEREERYLDSCIILDLTIT